MVDEETEEGRDAVPGVSAKPEFVICVFLLFYRFFFKFKCLWASLQSS
jgi:hypothetical protein